MIDLRSDTVTIPDDDMLQTILHAKLGDNGRTDKNPRGEDLSTIALEDMAAGITGKEMGLLFPTGTMANTAALLAVCQPGDKVLVGENQHIYLSEQVVFGPVIGSLSPVIYRVDEHGIPNLQDIRKALKNGDVKMITYENTHNFSGGFCIPTEIMKQIHEMAQEFHVPVHLDGARIFNAAIALRTSVSELCQYVDSVMFCLSKGLGSALGSVLCADSDIIAKARICRKKLGAGMRQCGIIAEPGIYALRHNVERLSEDHANAAYFSEHLRDLKYARIQSNVETNIVMLDISETGLSQTRYRELAEEKGLQMLPMRDGKLRFVFHIGIDREDTKKAVEIIHELDKKY